MFLLMATRGREGVLGDAGVLVDGNIIITVIDMNIFYINELCIHIIIYNVIISLYFKTN